MRLRSAKENRKQHFKKRLWDDFSYWQRFLWKSCPCQEEGHGPALRFESVKEGRNYQEEPGRAHNDRETYPRKFWYAPILFRLCLLFISYLCRKTYVIPSLLRWITLSRVIASFSLSSSTAPVASCSFTFLKSEDSRKMLPDSMLPTFCSLYITFTPKTYSIGISSPKTCL